MPDIAHYYGEDFEVTATGDLLTADGVALTDQRILRRLMTIGPNAIDDGEPQLAGEYVWHPPYGGSVPQRVGSLDTHEHSLTAAVVRGQMGLEAAVKPIPAPQIAVEPIPGGVNVTIAYTDGLSGKQQTLEFEATP